MGSAIIRGVHVSPKQVFSGKPYCTISQFSRNHKLFSLLPAQERKKVQDASDFVARSYSDPRLTGGFVTAIGIRSHADPESTKSGMTRSESERQASEEYANGVATALMRAIKMRTSWFGALSAPVGEPFELLIECMGAKTPVSAQAANNPSQSVSAQVEIFLYQDKLLLQKAMVEFDLPPQKRLSE
jgi:hypothetical protein